MSHPLTLCVDITGTTFTALLHLKFGGRLGKLVIFDGQQGQLKSETDDYTLTGTGTVGGPAVTLGSPVFPCTEGGPEQSWTCEISSADATSASYTLRGGGEGEFSGGQVITGTIGTGACGIPDPLPCEDRPA